MVRKRLAQVLAGQVALGQYTCVEAVEIAGATFFDTPQALLKVKPRQS